MEQRIERRIPRISPKIHGLALGMTVGLSSMIWSQGCASSGLCPSCGACAVQLPIIFLPLLVDGTAMLANEVRQRVVKK